MVSVGWGEDKCEMLGARKGIQSVCCVRSQKNGCKHPTPSPPKKTHSKSPFIPSKRPPKNTTSTEDNKQSVSEERKGREVKLIRVQLATYNT